MKKKIVLLLLFLVATSLFGQSFKDRLNLVMFGGYYAKQQNSNANGHYEGIYGDFLPLKSDNGKWTAGLYGVASHSAFGDNISRYDGNIKEYGGGLTLGYYQSDLSPKYQAFVGLSLGVKYNDDQGASSSRWGEYVGKQKDWLIATALNCNLLSNAAVLPRTQVIVSFQIPIKSQKTAYWNDREIPGEAWNKTYVEVLAKQSLVNLPIGNIYLSPKLATLYSFSKGNKESKYSLGGEISLHQPYKDDFLSLYCFYKMSSLIDNQELSFGLNINLISLFN